MKSIHKMRTREGQGGMPTIYLSFLMILISILIFWLWWNAISQARQSARFTGQQQERLARSTTAEGAQRALQQPGNPPGTGIQNLRVNELLATPEFLRQLENGFFRALENNGSANTGVIMPDLEHVHDLPVDWLSARLGLPKNGLSLKRAQMRFFDVRRKVNLPGSGLFSLENYYREAVQGDWDAGKRFRQLPIEFAGRARLTLDFEHATAAGSRRYQASALMPFKVQDCYPLAQEFALFSYGSPSESIARTSLNGTHAGSFGVIARGVGRVHMRGPWFLKVEDPSSNWGLADAGGTGSRRTASPHVNYGKPDESLWAGYSTLPGPRAVPLPNFNVDLWRTIQGFMGGGPGTGFDGAPTRPTAATSRMGWLVGLTPDFAVYGAAAKLNFLRGIAQSGYTQAAGMMLGGHMGAWAPVWPPGDPLLVAPTHPYHIGSARKDEQRFALTGVTRHGAMKLKQAGLLERSEALESWTDGDSLCVVSPFNGMMMRVKEATDGSASRIETLGPTPVAALNTASGSQLALRPGSRSGPRGIQVQSGDVIVPEPAFYHSRADSPGTVIGPRTGNETVDLSIIGIYGVAVYERTIYWNFSLAEVIDAFTMVASVFTGGGAWLARGALVMVQKQMFGMAGRFGSMAATAAMSVRIIPMRNEVTLPSKKPEELDLSGDVARWNEQGYTPIPYGLHFDSGSSDWMKELGTDIMLASEGIASLAAIKAAIRLFRGGSAMVKNGFGEAARSAALGPAAPGAGVEVAASASAAASSPTAGVAQGIARQAAGKVSAGVAYTMGLAQAVLGRGRLARESYSGWFKAALDQQAGRISMMLGTQGVGRILSDPMTQSVFGRDRARTGGMRMSEKQRTTGPALAGTVTAGRGKGFMPPKYRASGFVESATAVHESMSAFLFAHLVERRGITLAQLASLPALTIRAEGIHVVSRMDYAPTNQKITYQGKFVVYHNAGHGADVQLGASFVAAEGVNHMSLVVDAANGPDGNDPHHAANSMLRLGPVFQGTVASTHGIRPMKDGGVTLIRGNLVCQFINRHRIPADAAVAIRYDLDQRLRADNHLTDIKKWWRLSLGRVTQITSAK